MDVRKLKRTCQAVSKLGVTFEQASENIKRFFRLLGEANKEPNKKQPTLKK